ncbi:LA_3751/LA_3752 family putative glycosyltransferase [Leptospira terpstrae]|uniref:LA_3751/LA_3752 family putative glycosyltransferase n=1 Tax=Leptospira terpstrae TaxID=293075 RepID=UPI003D069D20
MKKSAISLLIFGFLFLSIQLLVSANTSFISDSLTKATQIESSKQRKDSILYPAEKIDPEKKFHPVLFVIPNQGKLKSVFSEVFAKIYAILFYFLPIQWLMFGNGLILILSSYLLYRIGKIPVEISLLTFISSVVFSQVLDLSEVSLAICWISLSYSLWARGLEEKNSNILVFSIFLMVWGSFLRLEIFILSMVIYFVSLPFLYRQKKFLGVFYLTIAIVIPVFVFLTWNYFEYGHSLGIRYLFNYTISQSTSIGNRIFQLQKILFTSFSDPGMKLGFFLYSPYFLYILYLNRNQLKSFNCSNPIFFHLTVFLVYPILVGLSAPNDGITITSRYALFTIFPGIYLITNQWQNLKSNKIFYSLVIFSVIVNLFILKISKESYKMIRKTNQIYVSLKSDLWIFYDSNLSGTAGLSLLTQPSVSFQEFENETVRKSLFSRIRKENLKTIYIFDFSKTTPNSFMNSKRAVELTSENFIKLLREEGYQCNGYQEKSWIGYRLCNSIL